MIFYPEFCCIFEVVGSAENSGKFIPIKVSIKFNRPLHHFYRFSLTILGFGMIFLGFSSEGHAMKTPMVYN